MNKAAPVARERIKKSRRIGSSRIPVVLPVVHVPFNGLHRNQNESLSHKSCESVSAKGSFVRTQHDRNLPIVVSSISKRITGESSLLISHCDDTEAFCHYSENGIQKTEPLPTWPSAARAVVIRLT